jgi:tetratricopeptide (TPR) repeat protein
METKLELSARKAGQFLFVAAVCLTVTACSQNETVPSTEASTPTDAVENWMEKRTERRKAAMSRPQEVATPVAKTIPVQSEKPVAMTAVSPPAPVVAPIVVEKKFSKRVQTMAEPSFPQNAGQNFAAASDDISTELEMGYAALTQGDYDEAFRRFIKAAELGNSDAQLTVGMMYATGEGVSQDYEEALKWIALALERGDLNAQQLLGLKDFLSALRQASIAEEQQAIASLSPVNDPPITPIPQIRYSSVRATSAGISESAQQTQSAFISRAGVMMESISQQGQQTPKQYIPPVP